MTQFRQFDLAIEGMMGLAIDVGAQVEAMVDLAVAALSGPESEHLVKAQIRVEESCLTLEKRCNDMLALQSPRAGDLRLLIATTRLALDLQRVAEISIDITRRAKPWRESALIPPQQAQPLAELAQDMLHRAVSGFVHADPAMAKQVIQDEARADHLARDCFNACQGLVMHNPENVAGYTHMLRTVGHIEHLIDIAVDIAEEAVYVHTGVLARHALSGNG